MTKEEALIQLRLGPGINEDVSEEYNEAVDMAIKALEQQPSEGEQIIKVSKGALKARTGRYVIYDVEWLKEHFNTTEAKIYGQPKEELQQKTGHWIMRKRDGSGWKDTTVYVNSEGTITESRDEGAYCKCSECGEWLVGSDEYVCGARYCPRCGAKMQEVQE